jgi:hypothetical protein
MRGEKQMQNKLRQLSRRRFLKRLGAVTGGSALLALGTRGKAHAQAAADTDAAKPRSGRGYRLTAHIRAYYEKAGL